MKLYSSCTLEMFREVLPTRGHRKNGKHVVLNARTHTVALNDNGTCTRQQFGNLAQAREAFDAVRSTL